MNTTTTSGLVCEAHPDMPFPHDGCPGPGAPERHRADTLTAALSFIRIGAQFGDQDCADFLDARGIDHRSVR